MAKVPLIKADLPDFKEVEAEFREILENGKVTNFGKYVNQFEQDAAAYLGVQTATVSSGTMALLFTLQALGLRPGDKVILPSFSFMATAQAVCYAGGVPVYAEIRDDLNISPDDVDQLLSKHPEATFVIAVHIYGLPCQVDALKAVVSKHAAKRPRGLKLIYDAAHAFGAASGGRKVGTFGEAEAFSLSVTKALVTVEGGLVTSANADLIQRIKKMRNYGVESNYDAHYPGLNGKMSEFHAIVGIHNLRKLDRILAERAKKAAVYAKLVLSKCGFRVFTPPPGVTHTFKDFSVLVPPAWKPKRDAVVKFLAEKEVETRAYFFPPIHEQTAFKKFADRPLPVTEDLSRRVITLPFFTTITEEQMAQVADALGEAERALA